MSENVNFKIPTIIGVCVGVALLLSLATALNWLEFVELHLFRTVMFIQSKYSLQKEISQDLALIGIDKRSEEILVPMPWEYEMLTPLCKILTKSRTNGIGLFAQFDQPQSLEGCDNLFVAYQLQKSKATGAKADDFSYSQNFKNTGFIHVNLYPENRIYKAQLLLQDQYSLELMLACHHLGLDVNQLNRWIQLKKSFWRGNYILIAPPDSQSRNHSLKERVLKGKTLGCPFTLKIPVDEDGQMLINFAANSRLPGIDSFVDVLNANNIVKDFPSSVELQKYSGKLVLIGSTNVTGTAIRNTPFGVMSEFDLHAHAMNTILSSSFITKLTKKSITVYTFATCLSLAMTLLWLDRKQMRRRYILASSTFFCVHVLICAIAFWGFGLWLNLLSPTIALTLCGITAKMASSHLELEAIHSQLMRGFSHLWGTYSELKGSNDKPSIPQIVEMERIENAFEELGEAFRKYDNMKSELLRDVSHELNTPLSIVIGHVENLLNERITEQLTTDEKRQSLRTIHGESERLQLLVTNILNLRRYEDGRLQLTRDVVQLNPVIKNAIQDIQSLPFADKIDFKLSVPDDLPDVYADRNSLKQILLNLLDNAVKFTQQGTTSIEARNLRNNYIQVTVEDTGPGIPAEELELIFEVYRQANMKQMTSRGTGVGLAITQKLVEEHDGRIWAESEVGKGSRFIFTLPKTGARKVNHRSKDRS